MKGLSKLEDCRKTSIEVEYFMFEGEKSLC